MEFHKEKPKQKIQIRKPAKQAVSKIKYCERSFWIKYTLFAINVLVWVGGICLVVIGVWARLQKGQLNADNIIQLTDPALFLVAVGVIMFVISILGCLGSFKKHVTILKMFCVVMIIVFILQVTAGILAFLFIDKVEGRLLDYMKSAVRDYKEDKQKQETLDYIQLRYECCGSSSYADWEYNVHYSCSSPSQYSCGVPFSCCLRKSSVTCGLNTRRQGEAEASDQIYTKGCITSLLSLYRDNLIIVGFIAFIVGFLELIGIVLANFLINYIVYSKLKVNSNEKTKGFQAAYSQPLYQSTTAGKEAQKTRL